MCIFYAFLLFLTIFITLKNFVKGDKRYYAIFLIITVLGVLYLLTIANSNFEAWLDANPNASIYDFKFDFKKMSDSGSLFDVEKLYNISKNYISKLSANEVYNSLFIYTAEYDKEFNELIKKLRKDLEDAPR